MTSVMKHGGLISSARPTRTRSNAAESEVETAAPDSTTTCAPMDKETMVAMSAAAEFFPGQDVLLKQKDDRYYLGTVVEVDGIREQCLVKFGDNTDSWSSFKDLTKLSTPGQEDILCVVCKKSAPKRKQEITVCDKCGRGYHRKCHQPEVPIECQKDDALWMCKRCVIYDTPHQRLRKSDVKPAKRESSLNATSSTNDGRFATPSTKVLPYDLNSLTWDTYHRVNTGLTYCYCGENGEWYKQMLQCGRCKQWFHEKCVDFLQYPLYCGDRFYVFVCSICNNGNEFLRRLELKWVDVVHLMLFNLTVYNSKKYYDLDTIIIPYINDNWHALNLPPKISTVCKAERRETILSVLTNNRNRFKCGREIKKRTTIWGLRVRLPPPAPTITLTFSGRVYDDKLKEMWQGNRRLQFLPAPEEPFKIMVPCDAHMKNLMMGLAYQESGNPSETDSPCPSPDGREPVDDRGVTAVNTRVKDICDKLMFKGDFTGCVKKSAKIVSSSKLQKKKRLMGNMLRRRREANDGRTDSEGGDHHHHRDRYPTRLSLDSSKAAYGKHQANANDSNGGSGTMPLTPPTSVSAPPTPPASGSNSLMSDLSNDFNEHHNAHHNHHVHKGGDVHKKFAATVGGVFEGDNNNTPCDTSGDETSSKSTLDQIIPPPKDFEGKNNPFLALLRGNASNSEERGAKGRKSKDQITLPLPLTAVIPGKPVMRPTKRQLSEKDIVVGPNGEVKRRRLRRNQRVSGNQSPYAATQTASKTAAVVPIRPSDAKEWSSHHHQRTSGGTQQSSPPLDYALNGVRRLRQRPEKQPEPKPSPQPSPKPSPVKNEPDIDIDDLKSSVNMYFGAANRIAAGERYAVKAKRIGPTGKIEFLIEWEGPGNGMT